jgi:hypothetical protein
MKSFFGRRKGIALLAAGAVAVVAAIAGYAFFTASGSGTGTITVGTASSVELTSDPVGGVVPGGGSTPVTVHVHNPSTGTQHVGQVGGAVRTDGDCLGTWFTVTPSAAVGSLAGGATADTTVGVAMTETGAAQDACQGKPLTVDWSTGAGSSGGGSPGGGSSGGGSSGGGGTSGGCASIPHAQVTCGPGGTFTFTCDAGYADRDGNALNGCETDLTMILASLVVGRSDALYGVATVTLGAPARVDTAVQLSSSSPDVQITSAVVLAGRDWGTAQISCSTSAGAEITATLGMQTLHATLASV